MAQFGFEKGLIGEIFENQISEFSIPQEDKMDFPLYTHHAVRKSPVLLRVRQVADEFHMMRFDQGLIKADSILIPGRGSQGRITLYTYVPSFALIAIHGLTMLTDSE